MPVFFFIFDFVFIYRFEVIFRVSFICISSCVHFRLQPCWNDTSGYRLCMPNPELDA
jgi:hypothetical protein